MKWLSSASLDSSDREDAIQHRADIVAEPPTDGVDRDSSEDQADGVTQRLSLAHGREANVASQARRTPPRHQADGRRQAHGDGQPKQGPKDG